MGEGRQEHIYGVAAYPDDAWWCALKMFQHQVKGADWGQMGAGEESCKTAFG